MSRFNQHFTNERSEKAQAEAKKKPAKESEEEATMREMRREIGVNKRLDKILIGR